MVSVSDRKVECNDALGMERRGNVNLLVQLPNLYLEAWKVTLKSERRFEKPDRGELDRRNA